MSKPKFVYVTYIRTTPEKLWNALTDPRVIRQYWFGVHGRMGLEAGLVVAPHISRRPGRRLRRDHGGAAAGAARHPLAQRVHAGAESRRLYSRCTMTIEPIGGAVKLMVTHELEQRRHGKFIDAVSGGWPKICRTSSRCLETGAVAYEEKKAAHP